MQLNFRAATMSSNSIRSGGEIRFSNLATFGGRQVDLTIRVTSGSTVAWPTSSNEAGTHMQYYGGVAIGRGAASAARLTITLVYADDGTDAVLPAFAFTFVGLNGRDEPEYVTIAGRGH